MTDLTKIPKYILDDARQNCLMGDEPFTEKDNAKDKGGFGYPLLSDGWRDVREELPVTPFLAYWTDDRITVLEDGDSVSYALTGDPDKRIIAWIPLSEIGKPAFA